MAGELRIDYDQFHRRLGLLYKAWKVLAVSISLLKHSQNNSDGVWKDITSFIVSYGTPRKNDIVYQKSIALHDWLFGYELAETLMLFTHSALHILTSKKKAELLQPLTKKDDAKFVVPLVILVRSKEQDPEHFHTLIKAAKEAGPDLGALMKDSNVGDFITAWTAALNNEKDLNQVEVGPCLACVLAVKDENEIKFTKSAASITSAVLKKHFVAELERIVDEGVKVKHSEFSEKIDKLFQNPEKISPKLNPDAVEACYSPIIQSGGKYDLKPSASSDDEELHVGTILVSLGARYKLYCSTVSRTFFIDPKPEQKANYSILLGAYAEATKALKPGEKLSTVYNAAAQHIEKNKPELLPAFLKSCGFGLGLEFRDGSLLISPKNEKIVQAGMVFNLSLGLHNLELPAESDPRKKVYSLLVADTFLIGESGAEVLTNYPTSFDEVSYSLEDEAPQEVKKEAKPKKEMHIDSNLSERRLREKEKDRAKESSEQKRKEHQEELARKKREEAEARFKKARETKTGGEVKAPVEDVVAYPTPTQFPNDALPHKIYVDPKHESVLLPVYGVLVPFHISYIKNASKTDEELRINFVAPGAPVIGTKIAGMKENVVYIREMTYKCVDAKNLNNSLRMIKELRKRVTAREAHEKEIKSVVTQEKLIVNKPGVKAPKLTEIFIRPNISGRRTAGTLEAHKNGLRFSSSKGSQVDILYKNVKHAFMQPAEHEMLVLIHFHLHDGIMVGKKKTSDVQFYTEVMELSHALEGGGKRSMYDADEIEDEQRERELRARMNDEFQKFVRKVEEAAGQDLEFDIPYRDLGFHGVPHRASVFMQPTVNCLVHLTEPPFSVITLAEVEVASLERVQFSLKNFDLVFIFKDFTFTHINTIPMDSLETIKEWLDSCNIKYYESPQNLNWGRITAHIKENPEDFYKEGGFEFLSSDNEEGEEEESEESDQSFKGDNEEAASDAGSGSDSEDDEEYEEDASEEEDSLDEEESEEDAPSWDELERDAAKADKERGHIDEDAPRGKRKGGEYSDEEADKKPKASKPKATATPAAASKPKSVVPSKK